MNNIIAKKYSVIFFYLLSVKLIAQSVSISVIGSAGGCSLTPSFSIESNIGEVLVNTIQSNNNIVTQGFEQPMQEILSSISNSNSSNNDFLIYPNPTSNTIWISCNSGSYGTVIVSIVDTRGREIFNSEITPFFSDFFLFDFSKYSEGLYFISLMDSFDHSIIFSHKLIKQ